MNSIEVQNLTKKFGSFTAVDNVSFSVKQGEIFGFLGANGAGKSTTIRMLTGILEPTPGDALVGGYSVMKQPDKVKTQIGYMSQKFSLYNDLTVEENIRFFAGVYGLAGMKYEERKKWALKVANLEGKEKLLTGSLPGGIKQRLQSGFEFNTKVYMYKAVISMMFTDAIADMYYSTVIREVHKGEAQRVAERYLRDYMEGNIPTDKKALVAALERAVADFNAIEVDDKVYPKAGIVGEIYVKYNPFSNNNAAQWLMEQGVEVVIPTFWEFFAGGLIHTEHSVKTNLERHDLTWLLCLFEKKILHNYLEEVHDIMKNYRRFHRHPDIETIARNAQEILSLNHQYGGWLIAGEVASFAKNGINNVLCLQPFGCMHRRDLHVLPHPE